MLSRGRRTARGVADVKIRFVPVKYAPLHTHILPCNVSTWGKQASGGAGCFLSMPCIRDVKRKERFWQGLYRNNIYK